MLLEYENWKMRRWEDESSLQSANKKTATKIRIKIEKTSNRQEVYDDLSVSVLNLEFDWEKVKIQRKKLS